MFHVPAIIQMVQGIQLKEEKLEQKKISYVTRGGCTAFFSILLSVLLDFD